MGCLSAPREIDEYELVDPVDILTPLENTGFWDGVVSILNLFPSYIVTFSSLVAALLVYNFPLQAISGKAIFGHSCIELFYHWHLFQKAAKWSERKEAVAELTKLVSTKRIAPGDFTEICRTLRKVTGLFFICFGDS